MSDTTELAPSQVLLAEYEQLKSEQKDRIRHRDGLMYSALAAMVAAIAGTSWLHSAVTLLALPPVAVLLGWTYLANDRHISAIGRYVATELAPRLAQQTGTNRVFAWELARRTGSERARKIMQLAVDLTAFCLLPLAALIAFWATGPAGTGWLLLSIPEFGLVTALGGFIAWRADVGRSPA